MKVAQPAYLLLVEHSVASKYVRAARSDSPSPRFFVQGIIKSSFFWFFLFILFIFLFFYFLFNFFFFFFVNIYYLLLLYYYFYYINLYQYLL